ncbi:hypothetical protein BDA96_10G115100 [Sorghum bicolor]|nr:hypothetical protein BDA96_10G115100 [Sorghum bicolor]
MPYKRYVHRIINVSNSYRLAMGVQAPERVVDVFAWKHILPSGIPVIEDSDLDAFIFLQFMSAWNNGKLMPISTDSQRLRKKFVIDLLAYDGNSRCCMIPLSVREYLSRITGIRQ